MLSSLLSARAVLRGPLHWFQFLIYSWFYSVYLKMRSVLPKCCQEACQEEIQDEASYHLGLPFPTEIVLQSHLSFVYHKELLQNPWFTTTWPANLMNSMQHDHQLLNRRVVCMFNKFA